MWEDEEKYKLEFLDKDLKRTHYDGCHEGNIDESNEFYKKRFKWIGSSCTYFVNGVRNKSKKIMHFYIYK